MTLTLYFQGQILNTVAIFLGKLNDRDVSWIHNGLALEPQYDKYIGQVMGRCETVTVSNLLAHEKAIHSLI